MDPSLLKLNVHNIYKCGSGGSCCDYRTASYCMMPEVKYASGIRRGVGSIVRVCASDIDE